MIEIQLAFSSGEVAPALYGRSDVDRWKAALKLCSNWVVQPEGGIIDRQGFELKASITGSDIRMIPFEFGPADSYVVAAIGTKFYFIRNGSLVADEDTPFATFTVNSSLTKANLRWVQSGDTVYLVDGILAPYKLTREALGWEATDATRDDNWTLTAAPMTPTITASVTVTITPVAGTDQIRYRVSYTDKEGAESAPLRGATVTGTASLVSSRWNINKTAHGLETNDTVEVTEAKSSTAAVRVYEVGDFVRIQKVDVDNFSIAGVDSAVSGNFKYRTTGDSEIGAQPSTGSPRVITWTAVPGADFYNLYREYGRVFGYIGSTSNVTFSDPGIIPDTKDTPILGKDPTRAVDANGVNAPSAVGLFQQRLMYGGFSADTERIVGSHIGNYVAFDPGAEDASGLDFELAGRTVSGIQHMLEIAGRAVVLTNTAEWVLKGSTGGGLTPTAINARVDSYHGSSSVVPALVGTSLIYVQRGSRIVRDAQYDFGQEALVSRDLTLWAKHLFKQTITRVVYQRTAGLVWCLRSDGVLLGLTYIPDQNIWGWHQHTISGRSIVDLCVVSESNTDRLYVATIDSGKVNICRLPNEWISGDVDDHLGFDQGLTYDGRLAGYATLTGGTTWKTTETLTLTASSSVFAEGDVGKDFLLKGSAGEKVYLLVTGYTSGTVLTVRPKTIVPTALRSVASTSWARCASTVSGLAHLEGQTVGVIADGSAEPQAVVSSGAITLSRPFGRVQVGLPIVCDAQTLDLEASEKDTSLGDFKHVTRVILQVNESRGAHVGLSESTLEPMFPEYSAPLSNATPDLQSGAREVLMDATHTASGSILIRQSSGLPSTILTARTVFNEGTLR